MNAPSTASVTAHSGFENRVFLYEVVGLWPSLNNNLNRPSIQHNGSILLTVPYSQMGETMQRINRMGAKIISIKPLKEVFEANGLLSTGP
jgi:CpcD/allophycocyanin linker domain